MNFARIPLLTDGEPFYDALDIVKSFDANKEQDWLIYFGGPPLSKTLQASLYGIIIHVMYKAEDAKEYIYHLTLRAGTGYKQEDDEIVQGFTVNLPWVRPAFKCPGSSLLLDFVISYYSNKRVSIPTLMSAEEEIMVGKLLDLSGYAYSITFSKQCTSICPVSERSRALYPKQFVMDLLIADGFEPREKEY